MRMLNCEADVDVEGQSQAYPHIPLIFLQHEHASIKDHEIDHKS